MGTSFDFFFCGSAISSFIRIFDCINRKQKMSRLRNPTASEIAALEAAGVTAEAWSQVVVNDDFDPSQLQQCRLEGSIELASGARIRRSCVRNYRIGENSLIEDVTALECRRRSTFGNGVGVAAINECAGRTVRMTADLSAQIAYLMAVYRHRPQLIATLERMTEAYAEAHASEMGEVGRDCRIVGARFIREVRIGDNVTVDGASALKTARSAAGPVSASMSKPTDSSALKMHMSTTA